MWVLGLSGSHNGAAALIKDGEVVVAIQKERITRRKRDGFRLDEMSREDLSLIDYCLTFADVELADVEAIAAATPWAWIHPHFVGIPNDRLPRFVTVPHHLAHAEYALHYSPMSANTMVLVCDGSGTLERQRSELEVQEIEKQPIKHIKEFGKESVSAYAFDGTSLQLIYRTAHGYSGFQGTPEMPKFLDSIGYLWRWASWYCHGSYNEAGKVMGLAPYGNPEVHADLHTISIDDEGRVSIDFDSLGRRFTTPAPAGTDVTGIAHYEDVAAHVQSVTNTFLVRLVAFLQRRHPTREVCYSGGVALNGISNEHLIRELGVELYMNGSCEDNGTAIGAALGVHHALTGRRVRGRLTDFYGREYCTQDIESALRDSNCDWSVLPWESILESTARALAAGQVVGWHQGRSEFGPRALGNRSILGDPRGPNIRQYLNESIKHRESFRPYAPAVLEERAHEFFDLTAASPMMLRVTKVKVDSIPGVTHVDHTARVQTVSRSDNPKFYELIERFGHITGIPILLNTSFNIAGQPIVESPKDALRMFLASKMDILVMGNCLVRMQPANDESSQVVA